MLDWLRKELINQYCYSNIDQDRSSIKHEIINGRTYDKYGVDCATTAYALVYKVPVPGVKQFKFAIQIGIARQHPYDSYITKDEGIEVSKENALIDPVMTILYDKNPTENIINGLIESYVYGLPVQFIKTKEEIKAAGKNPNDYSRFKNDEYNEYYKDLRKHFKNMY